MLTQIRRDHRAFPTPLQPLGTSLGSPRCAYMAGIAVATHGSELRIRMVCPDIRGLHSGVPVLTVRDCVSGQPVHEVHLPHPSPRIFNKPVPRRQRQHQTQNVLIHSIAEFCVVTDRGKVSVFLPAAVMTDCRNGVGGAIGAGPNYIRPTEFFDNFLGRNLQDVCIQINVSERFVPLHTENFVPSGFKCLSNASCSCKKF